MGSTISISFSDHVEALGAYSTFAGISEPVKKQELQAVLQKGVPPGGCNGFVFLIVASLSGYLLSFGDPSLYFY